MKNQERYLYHYFFVLIITLKLSKIFSDALMFIGNKPTTRHSQKSSCIFARFHLNILNHSSGNYRDSLTMAALSFIKSSGLCTIFIHQYLLSHRIIVSSKYNVIPIPLLGLVSINSKLHDHDTKNKAITWLSSHPSH